jgi:membrane associated rhomboid family serine protease
MVHTIMAIIDHVKQAKDRWKANALIIAGMVGVMFLLEVVDLVLPGAMTLDRFGVRPRTLSGLPCIFLAPWLHLGFGHLLANSVMFLILGWLLSLSGWRHFCAITACVVVVSGLGVFLFGSAATIHLGSSGVVFGFLGYLLARGYYERKPLSILLSGVVLFLYYEMVFKLLSVQPHISWSSHFFGFLGGIGSAWFFHGRKPTGGEKKVEKKAPEPEPTAPLA